MYCGSCGTGWGGGVNLAMIRFAVATSRGKLPNNKFRTKKCDLAAHEG